jgi:hypothetical protein
VEHAVGNLPATVLGPRLAAGIELMAQEARITLDYSLKSMALVDRVIDGLRTGGPSADVAMRVLRGFGAYAGEVLVREIGAVWTDFDDAQRDMFGQSFGIRTPDGRLWNPLGKAVKRYENGPEDSLRLFCLAVVGQAGR